jgi:hypothetical protein
METREIHEPRADAERRRRPFTRGLLIAALAAFTLPFVTVTCYSDDVRISGIEAATTIDLTRPGASDHELAREGESANVFAIVGLVATIAALLLSFSSAVSGRVVAWIAAIGVAALPGLWFYAQLRSSGNAVIDVGMAATIAASTAAAWSTVRRIPRWVGALGSGTAAVMLVSTLGGADAVEDVQILAATAWIGTVAATCLAFGAALRRDDGSADPVRPSVARQVLAVASGLAILGAGVIMPFVINSQTEEASDSVIGAIRLAGAYVICVALASIAAWVAGGAIAHGRRSRPVAIAEQPLAA